MARINTNIAALQARHRMATNYGSLSQAMERLSTGLRINRGKDDPAGLIASEVLRNEIQGITQAIDNSQRAINVISTAEGALNEISALLIEMKSLINHAANEGAISDAELEADQLQLDSLLTAIDRIANTTQFAGERLLNGNFDYTLSNVAASSIARVQIYGARVPDGSYKPVTVQVTSSAETAMLQISAGTLTQSLTVAVTGDFGTTTLTFGSGSTTADMITAINGEKLATGVSAVASGAIVNLSSTQYGSDSMVTVKSIEGSFNVYNGATISAGNQVMDKGEDVEALINGVRAAGDGLRASVRTASLDAVIDLTVARATTPGSTSFEVTGGGALFQIGPEVNPNGQVNMGIPSLHTTNLGNPIDGFLHMIADGQQYSLKGGNYPEAERILIEATEQVSVLRGRLGGLQKNQIETNINSQRVALENVTAAESAIRDADMAVEVSHMTRSQILVQSTSSVLGIANQLPNLVLSLLQ